MANPKKTSTEQPYAEFLEQREGVKKIIEEYLSGGQFRELNQKLIKDYHGTLDYQKEHFTLSEKYLGSESGRLKFSALLEEHKTIKVGGFIKKNGPILFWVILTAIVTAGAQNYWPSPSVLVRDLKDSAQPTESSLVP